MISYGYMRGKELIVHIIGEWDEDESLGTMKEAVNDPRWVPTKSKLIIIGGVSREVEIKTLYGYGQILEEYKPYKIGFMRYTPESQRGQDTFIQMFRQKFRFKIFYDLEKLLAWIGCSPCKVDIENMIKK